MGAAVFLLLLAAILMAPFLLTAQLVYLALGQVFPASHMSVGSAVLSLSGALVMHDLVLHDTGELAQQPLVIAREVDVAFGWAELLSRRIQANGVTVYARANGASQLSLLDLFPQKSQSGSPAEANRGLLPIWIDTLHLWDRSSIHRGSAIDAVCQTHPRLHREEFLASAPELNSAEQGWNDVKGRMANTLLWDTPDLRRRLSASARRVRRSQAKPRSVLLSFTLPSPP
jgi:hypothetical protein